MRILRSLGITAMHHNTSCRKRRMMRAVSALGAALLLAQTAAFGQSPPRIEFTRYLTMRNGVATDLPDIPAIEHLPYSSYPQPSEGFGKAFAWNSKETESANVIRFRPQTGPLRGQDMYFMYVHGNPGFVDASGKSYAGIGVYAVPVNRFTGATADWLWLQKHDPSLSNPILSTYGEPSNAFDYGSPISGNSAVVFHGKIFLYYELPAKTTGTKMVGVAVSDDGLHFTRVGLDIKTRGYGLVNGTTIPVAANIILPHYGEPTTIVANDKVYLFVRHPLKQNRGAFTYASSSDGMNFDMSPVRTNSWTNPYVLYPSDTPGAFDQWGISTARLYYESGYYYMIYGGAPTGMLSRKPGRCADYPDGMGLMRIPAAQFPGTAAQWQRYAYNPILLRGPSGSWAEGAIWAGTLLRADNGTYYMWYETAGTDSAQNPHPTRADARASNIARTHCYGDFGRGSAIQVGLSTFTPPAGRSLTDLWRNSGSTGGAPPQQ